MSKNDVDRYERAFVILSFFFLLGMRAPRLSSYRYLAKYSIILRDAI